MRNPDRIAPTLAAIEAAWRLVPDWRLGQLLVNLAGRDGRDLFFIEEDALVVAACDLIELQRGVA